MAWLSMERDGYEADKNRLMVRDMASGEITDLTTDWDYTIEEFAWNPNGKSLWFIAYHQGVAPVFSIDVDSKAVTTVAEDVCDFNSISPVSETAVVTMAHSMLRPNEVYLIDGSDAKGKRITAVNDDIFNQLRMPSVEKRMVPTTDGKQMLTWIVKPQDFDSTKTYPSILYCQEAPKAR